MGTVLAIIAGLVAGMLFTSEYDVGLSVEKRPPVESVTTTTLPVEQS